MDSSGSLKLNPQTQDTSYNTLKNKILQQQQILGDSIQFNNKNSWNHPQKQRQQIIRQTLSYNNQKGKNSGQNCESIPSQISIDEKFQNIETLQEKQPQKLMITEFPIFIGLRSIKQIKEN